MSLALYFHTHKNGNMSAETDVTKRSSWCYLYSVNPHDRKREERERGGERKKDENGYITPVVASQ